MKNRVLVLGEICSDISIEGVISRFSPEDKTIPVLKIKKRTKTLGMAGNVFNNLSSMGARGIYPHSMLNPSIKKIRVYNQKKQIIRIDYDKYKKDWTNKELISFINKIKDSLSCIIISDYGKGYFNKELLQYLGRLGIFTLVDPYTTTPINWYNYCSILIPNLKEAEIFSGKKSLNQIFNKLFKQVLTNRIIIKDSERGCYLQYWCGKKIDHYKPLKVIKNPQVCGAGDSFIAAFAYLFTLGYNLEQCCIGANMAAGIVVQKTGTAVVTEKEFNKIIKYLNKK